MKRRRTFSLVVVFILFAIVSYVVSGFVFRLPTKNAKAPTVESIGHNFPDVTSDPTYTSIFNAKALDPTQPVQIGGSSNNQPFVGH